MTDFANCASGAPGPAMRSCLAAAMAGMLLLLAPAGVLAGGFSNADFGARRMGMFAVIGYPDDLTAIFHNPAGLVLSDGTELYLHGSFFFSELGFRLYDSHGNLRPDHEITPDWSFGAIPFLAVATDFGTGRFRMGIALYAPNAYGASLPADEPTRYHALEALFVAGRLTTTFAAELTEHFNLALNFNAIYVYFRSSKMLNLAVMFGDPDNRFLPVEQTRDSDIRMDVNGSEWTFSWDIGMLFKLTDSLRIGAVFASGSPVDLEGDVKLTYPDGSVEETTHTTGMVIPFSLSAGIHWRVVDQFELAADIRYWHYQVFQEQVTQLSEGVTALGITEFREPKNYGNSWNWCVGLLYRPIEPLDIMLGYQQDYSPIPDTTFTLENPSRDQHGVSLGLRWRITPKVRIGLAFVRNWFDLVDVQTSVTNPPSNAKGHGANSELGIDLTWKL